MGGVDEILALLAMRHGVGFGRHALAQALLEWRSPLELCELSEFRPFGRDWRVARRQWAAMRQKGVRMLPVYELPVRLRRAVPLPVALFIRGKVELLGGLAIGIVGSRNAAPDAEAWAYDRASRAARKGYVVVSGGARGIDSAAHRGALDAGGHTIAYLGVAADAIYPARNRELFARILTGGGALVSEHPPCTETLAYEHARRNRFIAGHASELLVAEAAEGSGTLGTVGYAERFGVPVRVSGPGVGWRREGLEALLRAGRAEIV